jgi:gamma-glutamylcyclotransferase (GGCT)/AIG2-like uncharacterized protein YtfP
MNLPFFVYGTLKRGEPNYARYLAGHTIAEVPATLPAAALYTAGPYPFLVQTPGLVAPGDHVYGSLVTIRPAEYATIVGHLDDLEGYRPGAESNLYERVVITVHTAGGPQEAYLYIAGTAIEQEIRAGLLYKVVGGNWRSGRHGLPA